MPMRVVWTRAAVRNIEQAYNYVADFNPRAAMQVAGSLFAAGERLATFPHRGRLVPRTNMRELVTSYPYVIRYRIDGNALVILRVRHASRRPTNL